MVTFPTYVSVCQEIEVMSAFLQIHNGGEWGLLSRLSLFEKHVSARSEERAIQNEEDFQVWSLTYS